MMFRFKPIFDSESLIILIILIILLREQWYSVSRYTWDYSDSDSD